VLNTNDIYFEPGVYEKMLKSRPMLTAVVSAMASQPGIARVFRSEELRGAAGSKDALLRAAALSYVPGRSGDLVFATRPGVMISSAGTTHGSASVDDQRVPMLFLGRGVKPGTYGQAVTPADLTPTLAALSGLAMKAEGHVLAMRRIKGRVKATPIPWRSRAACCRWCGAFPRGASRRTAKSRSWPASRARRARWATSCAAAAARTCRATA